MSRLRQATRYELRLLVAAAAAWHPGIVPGGINRRKHPGLFDVDQLAIGTKIEMEHTSSPGVAVEIAMDHLVEDPMYYSKLERMERGHA